MARSSHSTHHQMDEVARRLEEVAVHQHQQPDPSDIPWMGLGFRAADTQNFGASTPAAQLVAPPQTNSDPNNSATDHPPVQATPYEVVCYPPPTSYSGPKQSGTTTRHGRPQASPPDLPDPKQPPQVKAMLKRAAEQTVVHPVLPKGQRKAYLLS